MLHSVRARLTAWYAGVFGVFELVFALAAYGFVARTAAARIDEELAETTAAVIDALESERRAGAYPAEAISNVLREFRIGDAALGVFDRGSRTAFLAFEIVPEPADRHLHAPPAPPANFRSALGEAPAVPAFATVPTGGAPVRLFTVPYRFGRRQMVVGAAQSLGPLRRTLGEARLALLIGAPMMLLFAAAGGYALARKSLRPVATMTAQAAQIGAGTLHERLPVANARDELGRLGTVFNDLLGRLQDAFERQRRFMADASHELRTPVAIIGAEAEIARERDDRSPDELRRALATIDEEASRLTRIVEEMFLLARADAGAQPIVRENLYLADLARDVADRMRTLAGRKQLSVEVDAREDLPFYGDEGLLRRLLLNLLDNAIKHTPAGGKVIIRAHRHADVYLLEVTDTGEGIAPDAQPRVFDRFFRVERASGGGAGLGLAIARWIAEAHGGRLELARSDASGTTFALTLPAPIADAPGRGGRALPTPPAKGDHSA